MRTMTEAAMGCRYPCNSLLLYQNNSNGTVLLHRRVAHKNKNKTACGICMMPDEHTPSNLSGGVGSLPRDRIFYGLRSRLLLLVLLGALPVLGVTLHEGMTLRQLAAADAHKDALRLAQQSLADHQRLLGETHILLQALSRVPQLTAMAGEECNALLADLLEADERFANFGVIGADGLLRCSGRPFNPPVDFSQRAYFRRAMASGHFAQGDYQIGLLVQQPVLVMAHPFYNHDQEELLQGVIYASLRLQWLSSLLAEARLPDGSVLVLLDAEHNVLAHYPDPERMVGKNLRARFTSQELHLTGDSGTFEATGLDGVRRLFGQVRVADLPGEEDIRLLVGIPAVHAYASVNEILFHLLLVGGLAVLAMLGGGWILGGALVGRGMERLSQASARLAAGELAVRVVPEGVREVATLGVAFNHMADELERQMREVRRLNRVYRVLSGINGALLRVRERQRLLHEACCLACHEGEFPLAWAALQDDTDGEMRIVAQAGQDTALPQMLLQHMPAGDDSSLRRTVQSGEAWMCNDLHATTEAPAWREEALARGLPALAVLPLRLNDMSVGIFVLHAREAGFFDAAEMRLLREMAADISLGLEMAAREKSLHYIANYDRITRLPNRYLFVDRLAQILARAQRDERLVTVVVVDLLDLRRISDSLGRHVGDQVLRETAVRLGASLREGDVVARVGGHSFALALTDMARPEDEALVVDRLMRQFPLTFTLDGQEVLVHARGGVAAYPEDGTDAHELLHHAEVAVHTTGGRHESTVSHYSPAMSAQESGRFQLERELQKALARREFWLAYQPVVDVRTRRVAGLEALLRWDSRLLGSVPPARFIPVAEESALIMPLGEWVLEQACRQALRWRQAGLPPVRLAVNVSVQQLQQQAGVDTLLQVLRRLAPEGQDLPLAVEVTESGLMDNLSLATGALAQVRALGIQVYVDDFGTGYSSLAYLRQLPVDVLKIDRSFIMELDSDPHAVALVESVITLAHGLGLRVVAEGVENAQQLAVLAQLGCDQAQGYLFSRPVPAAEVEALLQRETL